MNTTIKVVKKSLSGWLSSNFDEDMVATEIQEQENQGWQLVSSYGIAVSSMTRGQTDTLVFIYRKK